MTNTSPSSLDAVRVLVVINRMKTGGGAEGSMLSIVEGLQGSGVDFTVVSLFPWQPAVVARLEALGITCHSAAPGLRAQVRAVRTAIKRQRPHLVHTVLFDADLAGGFAAWREDVPVIRSVVNTQYGLEARKSAPSPWRLRLAQQVDRFLARHAAFRVHAISRATAEAAEQDLAVPAARIRIVPRGRDAALLGAPTAERRHAVRQALDIPESAPVVLNVGRHEHQKGHAELVEAFARVVAHHRDATLLIAGRDGTATEQIHKKIDEHRLADHVRILGQRDDIGDLSDASDVFAFASHWEGLGGAVLEAMALGVPVVSYDVPAVTEALGGTGVVVPIGDEQALAGAIDELLGSGSRRADLGSRAHARFLAAYTLESCLRGMRDLYHSAAADSTTGARRPRRGRRHQKLRVLAYHGVDNADAFDHQMTHLRRHYTPVRADEVVAAFRGGVALPTRAVWVTFDDGDRSVVETGLPILERRGVPATMFVCPGLITSGDPYWWDVVEVATAVGIEHPAATPEGMSLVTHLKLIPDGERRRIVSDLARSLAAGVDVPDRQLRDEHLVAWETAGNELGNHSWDHPCLNNCDVSEQTRQVLATDLWLQGRRGFRSRVFAYPNGNATEGAESVLIAEGYSLALLFDHRVASTRASRFRVSRLRVSSTASPRRFAAITSGWHSRGYTLKRAVTRLGPTTTIDTSRLRGRESIDAKNHELYEAGLLVEHYENLDELTPAEQTLFDRHVPDVCAVLDLGVGAGRTTHWLSERASQYVGIDYSDAMVDAARHKHPDADIRAMDASDLSAFPDESFDVVVFSYNGLDYLHPTSKRAACIAEIGRVLRPGGILIASSHNARAWLRPRPLAARGGALRMRAVQAYASARAARTVLPSRAFWKGAGYQHDPTTGLTHYATTPNGMARDFPPDEWTLVDTVGSRHPSRGPAWAEPWYYFVIRRQSVDVTGSGVTADAATPT